MSEIYIQKINKLLKTFVFLFHLNSYFKIVAHVLCCSLVVISGYSVSENQLAPHQNLFEQPPLVMTNY